MADFLFLYAWKRKRRARGRAALSWNGRKPTRAVNSDSGN